MRLVKYHVAYGAAFLSRACVVAVGQQTHVKRLAPLTRGFRKATL